MVLNLLVMGWLQMPWYKKIFTTFNKYQAKHIDLIQQVCIDAALNDAPYEVGDKIGQLVWMNFPEVIMNRLDNRDQLTETERGTGGFGSTGK
jgi:dUTPase